MESDECKNKKTYCFVKLNEIYKIISLNTGYLLVANFNFGTNLIGHFREIILRVLSGDLLALVQRNKE